MTLNLDPNDTSRFDNFNIISTTYKSVNDHAIRADVLYPKNLHAKALQTPRPVLVRIHGGGWIGADSLFPPFFAPWHFELAARHSAIIVTPNYRLIPEASAGDILSDIDDFWTWLHSSFPSFLQHETGGAVAADLDRVLVAGDSAGGHLSLLLGLRQPNGIRAVAAAYPGIDTKGAAFTQPRQIPVFGLPPFPKSTWTEHVDKIRSQQARTGKMELVSSDPRLERGPLMWACVQHGLFGDYFPPENREIHILDCLEDGARLPRGGVFVWHGEKDSVVPVEGSMKLKDLVNEKDPSLPFRLSIQPGEHGFDATASIHDQWFAEGMDNLVAAWLA